MKTSEGLSVVLQQGFAEPLRVEGRPGGICRFMPGKQDGAEAETTHFAMILQGDMKRIQENRRTF